MTDSLRAPLVFTLWLTACPSKSGGTDSETGASSTATSETGDTASSTTPTTGDEPPVVMCEGLACKPAEICINIGEKCETGETPSFCSGNPCGDDDSTLACLTDLFCLHTCDHSLSEYADGLLQCGPQYCYCGL